MRRRPGPDQPAFGRPEAERRDQADDAAAVVVVRGVDRKLADAVHDFERQESGVLGGGVAGV